MGAIVFGFTPALINSIQNTQNKISTSPPVEEKEVNIITPAVGDAVFHNFILGGSARGFWFFEGDTSVTVADIKGAKIGEGIAIAKGEWMTESFVPFTANISIVENYVGPAIIVFHKSNPSGLLEHEESFIHKINVGGEIKRAPGAYDSCVITGCSGTVCADEHIDTTCEWLPSYACYKDAVCERQSSGNCAWTESEDFIQCLTNLTEPPIALFNVIR
jgi:hypothetical protein